MSIRERIVTWYKPYERHLSSLALTLGFIFDILTLRRADTLWENFWIVLYLSIAASSILILTRRTHPWLIFLLQFSFGGLLSAFLILYFRSATLSVSWPFLLILALAFVANERLKGYHERLVFQVCFFYLSLLSFSIFFVPVLLGSIGSFIFIVSGVFSLFLVRLFLKALERVAEDKFLEVRTSVRAGVVGVFIIMNVLYFWNVIPPIPLSLKDANIYQSLSRDANGDYHLGREDKKLLDYFRPRQKVHMRDGDPLFAYTAVFSPARFDTDIIHEWQRLDPEEDEWVTTSRIALRISGGKDSGYRTYSISDVTPGRYRVNVLTEEGRVLGRIGFEAEHVEVLPAIVYETR